VATVQDKTFRAQRIFFDYLFIFYKEKTFTNGIPIWKNAEICTNIIVFVKYYPSLSKANIFRNRSCQRGSENIICNLSEFCLFLIRNYIIENEMSVVKLEILPFFILLKIGKYMTVMFE
jgi:hypothetical protein